MKNNLRNDAEAGYDTVANRASDWADRSRNAIDDAADTAATLMDRGRARARDAAGTARSWASDAAEVIADQSSRGFRTTTDMVRSQPVVAIGVTLIVGLLVGFLLSRDD